MEHGRILRAAVGAALLAGLTLPAVAVTQGAMTLDGFSYTLKDLAPAAGAAPVLSWQGQATFSGYLQDQTQVGWTHDDSSWYANWNPRSEAFVWDFGAVAGSTPQGFGQYAASGGALGFGGITLSAMVLPGQSSITSLTASRDFALSAGSSVTFRYLVNGGSNSSSVTGAWTPPVINYGFVQDAAQAYYSVSLGVGSGKVEASGGGIKNWTDRSGGFDQVVEDGVVQFTLRNTGATTQIYTLSATAYLMTYELAAPVPEPSSYALMTLGLLAIGGGARRRRT